MLEISFLTLLLLHAQGACTGLVDLHVSSTEGFHLRGLTLFKVSWLLVLFAKVVNVWSHTAGNQ